jgi:phosphoserine phosphatase RsbU/P
MRREWLSTLTCVQDYPDGQPARAPEPGVLHRAAPLLAGFDIAAASFPAQTTGGDHFAFLSLPDADLGIAIGDASGHGAEAARMMARTSAHLRMFAPLAVEPGQILTRMNRRLIKDAVLGDSFVTLLLARLQPQRRSLAYASAGHAAGYILDRVGAVRSRLRSTGLPLGVDATLDIAAGPTTILQPGEIVVLLTDGVVEAESPTATAFGTERMLEVARAHRGSRARTIVDALYQAVHRFAHDGRQRDDITVVIVKVDAS